MKLLCVAPKVRTSMKRTMILLVALFLCGMSQPSSGQNRIASPTAIDEAVDIRFREILPEWESKSVEPASIDGLGSSDRVRIRQWTSRGRNVRIAVLQHQSEQEATIALRQFAVDKKTNTKLLGFGDEAYLWGIRGSIAFRRGNLTLYITAVVTPGANETEAANDSADAKEKVEQSEREEAVVTKSFAQKLAAVLATL